MKKYFSIFSIALLLCACSKSETETEINQPVVKDGVSFTAAFTKVSTENGVNTWDIDDEISVFSVADGAAAGVSIGTNVAYRTNADGASVSFLAVDASVTASDKYYAFFPLIQTYPSALKADTEIGFTAKAQGDPVDDYRFMPVYVNSGATVQFDGFTPMGETEAPSFFYAQGTAPATVGDPVQLMFHPILPLLQLDLYGYGSIKSIEITFTDKTSDAFSQTNWLSAKGVFDLSTGNLKITNYSSSAFHRLTITLKEGSNNYLELQGTEPRSLKVPVGIFSISGGLTLKFTTADDVVITKNIWNGKTVSSTNAGQPKHLRQGINVPYVKASVALVDEFAFGGGDATPFVINTNTSWSVESKPDWISLSATSGTGGESITLTASANSGSARNGSVVFQTPEGAKCSVAVSQAAFAAAAASYYSVDLTGVDFSESYIYDVKNSENTLIARITSEFLGNVVRTVAEVVYPAPSGNPDYTDGLDLNNGGSVNAWTMDRSSVVYTPGSSSKLNTIWVKDDGSEILTSAPSGSVSAASVSPYLLTSPSGQNHALVKIGSQIWTAEGYKTSKLGDGTDITSIQATGTVPSETVPNYVSTTIDSQPAYLYNGPAVQAGLAPAGWDLPTVDQWKTDLAGFLGDASTYANMSTAHLFSRNTYKKPDASAPATLGYYNTWSNAASGTKWVMLLCKNATAPSTSAQAMKSSFEVRLIKQ